MSEFTPTNDLDRAIIAVRRSKANTPEFYRQLCEGELWFLMKYHPELEGARMELQNGSPVPFIQIDDEDGDVTPLFSSLERAAEGMKKGNVPEDTYLPACMPAKQVLELLGKLEWRAVVNLSCATGWVTIPPDLMRDLANGNALQPPELGSEETVEVKLKIVDPADYPTELIQPVFELLRKHRNFRAAWILALRDVPPVGGRQPYHLMILMEPRDEAIFHDFNMVIQAAAGNVYDVHLSLADETDSEYIAMMLKQAAPFYIATDYHPPKPAV